MDRISRLRRVGLLCVHFVRNCAYYRAGWNGKNTMAVDEFSVTMQGNSIDIAVLEWGKLFGDHDDDHHWKKVVEETNDFRRKMFDECGISQNDYDECWKSIKVYRDKFVAHLDSEEIMNIPVLDIPLSVAKFYYNYVLNELEAPNIRNLPTDIEGYYEHCYQASLEYYQYIKK